MNLLTEKKEDFSSPHELYILTQIFNNKETSKIYLRDVSELTIIKFTVVLAGTVVVYKYNKNDNSREDLTHRLGRIESEIRPFRKVSFVTEMTRYTKTYGEYFLKIKNVYMYSEFNKNSLIYLSLHNENVINVDRGLHETLWDNKSDFLNNYIINGLLPPSSVNKKRTKYIHYGSEYEKFIGNKYEKLGYKVIYNGINKGIHDSGIDLIVIKNNIHTLVQCKSWKDNKYHKINQKDIRAFIGDGYIYSINNNIEYNDIGLHFIIADEKSITVNAVKFIKNFTKLKFKVIAYEKD